MLHRVEAATIGQFAGVNTRKQPWRRERRSGGEDSPENPAIPWGTAGGSPENPGV